MLLCHLPRGLHCAWLQQNTENWSIRCNCSHVSITPLIVSISLEKWSLRSLQRFHAKTSSWTYKNSATDWPKTGSTRVEIKFRAIDCLANTCRCMLWAGSIAHSFKEYRWIHKWLPQLMYNHMPLENTDGWVVARWSRPNGTQKSISSQSEIKQNT